MKSKILNKYVQLIENEDSYILFNTYNEAIVTLKKLNILNNQVTDLKQEEYEYLRENDFFTNPKVLIKKYLKARTSSVDTLSITISLTQGCNLICSYCSQNNAKNNDIITTKVLDNIILYIQNRMNNRNYKFIAINFFGGEPLLAKKQILYFKNQLEQLFDSNIISYSVVTNGVLLDENFLKNFNNINVKVTLSEKLSHDKFRIFRDGSGSYDIILKNLKSIGKYLNGHSSRISLRYNVDNLNNQFKDFVQMVAKELPYIKYIEIAPIYNFDFNNKTSNFSKKEFTSYYLQSLEILLRNGFFVEFPTTKVFPCKAYTKDAIKIFSDGTLNVCNGCDCNLRRSNISLLINKKNKMKIFKDILKNQLTHKCIKCKNLFICSGNQLCRPIKCDFLNYDLEQFLKFYVKITKNSQYSNQFYTSNLNYD